MNLERGVQRLSIVLAVAWLLIATVGIIASGGSSSLAELFAVLVLLPAGIVGVGYLLAWAIRGFRPDPPS